MTDYYTTVAFKTEQVDPIYVLVYFLIWNNSLPRCYVWQRANLWEVSFQMYGKINWQTRIHPFPLKNTSNICFLDIHAFWRDWQRPKGSRVRRSCKEGRWQWVCTRWLRWDSRTALRCSRRLLRHPIWWARPRTRPWRSRSGMPWPVCIQGR